MGKTRPRPNHSGTRWTPITLGIDSSDKFLGCLWVGLVSCAAFRNKVLPRTFNVFGLAISAAGLIGTRIPALVSISYVFGIGAIALVAGCGNSSAEKAGHGMNRKGGAGSRVRVLWAPLLASSVIGTTLLVGCSGRKVDVVSGATTVMSTPTQADAEPALERRHDPGIVGKRGVCEDCAEDRRCPGSAPRFSGSRDIERDPALQRRRFRFGNIRPKAPHGTVCACRAATEALRKKGLPVFHERNLQAIRARSRDRRSPYPAQGNASVERHCRRR